MLPQTKNDANQILDFGQRIQRNVADADSTTPLSSIELQTIRPNDIANVQTEPTPMEMNQGWVNWLENDRGTEEEDEDELQNFHNYSNIQSGINYLHNEPIVHEWFRSTYTFSNTYVPYNVIYSTPVHLEESPSPRFGLHQASAEQTEQFIVEQGGMNQECEDMIHENRINGEIAPSETPQITQNNDSSPDIITIGDQGSDSNDSTVTYNNPLIWSVDQVCDFIRNIPECSIYAERFAEQEIDGEALLLLNSYLLNFVMRINLMDAEKIIESVDEIRP